MFFNNKHTGMKQSINNDKTGEKTHSIHFGYGPSVLLAPLRTPLLLCPQRDVLSHSMPLKHKTVSRMMVLCYCKWDAWHGGRTQDTSSKFSSLTSTPQHYITAFSKLNVTMKCQWCTCPIMEQQLIVMVNTNWIANAINLRECKEVSKGA